MFYMLKKFVNLYFLIACFSPVLIFSITKEQENLIRMCPYESRYKETNGPKLLFNKIEDDKEIYDNLDFKVYVYSLSLADFPLTPGQRLTLFIHYGASFGVNDVHKFANLFVDDKLNVYAKFVDPRDKSKPVLLEKFHIMLNGIMAGEAINYIVASNDFKTMACAHIVPNSIQSSGSSGQTIDLEMMTPDGSCFMLRGKNFKPNESITITSNSGSEKLVSSHRANEYGFFRAMFAPHVQGKKNGLASIHVRGEEGDSLLLRYVWGRDNLKKSQEQEISEFFKGA